MALLEANLHIAPKMVIALAHVIFNIGVTVILFWFRNLMANLACKMFKAKSDKNPIYVSLSDYSLIKKNTYYALDVCSHAIQYMSDLVVKFYKLTYNYAFENNKETPELAEKYEEEIDVLDEKIHRYLINITLENVDKDESNTLSKYLDTVKDLERIADHLTNIVEFFEKRYAASQQLSEEGSKDLRTMMDSLDLMVTSACEAINTWDKSLARKVVLEEPKVDDMEEVYRKRHVIRINKGICQVSELDFYVDILSNLERIGDHADNIAENVLNDVYAKEEVIDYQVAENSN